MSASIQGIHDRNRALLERLHRAAPGPFGVRDATRALNLTDARARRLLAYFGSRGWLARVRRGLYVTVPLGAASPQQWRADPWLVAMSIFDPCYIGGWSACEHWELTEQLFRAVVVVTDRRVRTRSQVVQGTEFRLKSLPKNMHFGLQTVWRGGLRVHLSDPTRTLVDVLDDPAIGGGVRQVSEVLARWFEREDHDERRLLDYTARLGNRTVYKRLGYLVEELGIDAPHLVQACLKRRSEGPSRLDPGVRASGRSNKRWNLRVNVTVGRAKAEP